MNIVISDPKTRKAYNINFPKPVFLGKKIGSEVELDVLNLKGYKAKITGGSDKCGFPMKPTVEGVTRPMVLLKAGVGYRPKEKGIMKRKRVRGNVIAEDINQLNLKITKYGEEPIEKVLGKEEKAESKGT
ncbi:MAG: 30S ribosomal protein S6e [Candidatus Diapherotrites archaeon]|nr:30S ribosomal protein S6e [Candidatus Diapherotrites archaeon]